MPELVGSVLAHFHVSSSCAEDNDRTYAGAAASTAANFPCRSSHAVIAANCAALVRAALVNRVWCTATLQLLWCYSPKQALSDGLVDTPGRCCMYARLLRHVHVSLDSALSRVTFARYRQTARAASTISATLAALAAAEPAATTAALTVATAPLG